MGRILWLRKPEEMIVFLVPCVLLFEDPAPTLRRYGPEGPCMIPCTIDTNLANMQCSMMHILYRSKHQSIQPATSSSEWGYVSSVEMYDVNESSARDLGVV